MSTLPHRYIPTVLASSVWLQDCSTSHPSIRKPPPRMCQSASELSSLPCQSALSFLSPSAHARNCMNQVRFSVTRTSKIGHRFVVCYPSMPSVFKLSPMLNGMVAAAGMGENDMWLTTLKLPSLVFLIPQACSTSNERAHRAQVGACPKRTELLSKLSLYIAARSGRNASRNVGGPCSSCQRDPMSP
ncbi:hypothetical protein EDD85DRAFT_864877 [Armillaria nabsnona]|nr:hypothetical protein EDD85DRAFT_864877 [Armillaria nabsnona]